MQEQESSKKVLIFKVYTNCCLRNLCNMSDKDLFHVSTIKDFIHIRQTDAGFQKAEVDFLLTYFCVKVEQNSTNNIEL